MSEATIEHTVPFHDVDPLLVVWHGHYFKYFEYAREALMRALSLDAPDLVALGYRMMVVESHCRHHRPLRHGERFTVRARLGAIDHKIMVHFEVSSAAHEHRVARGHTALVTLNAEGELLHDTPAEVRARLSGELSSRAGARG